MSKLVGINYQDEYYKAIDENKMLKAKLGWIKYNWKTRYMKYDNGKVIITVDKALSIDNALSMIQSLKSESKE